MGNGWIGFDLFPKAYSSTAALRISRAARIDLCEPGFLLMTKRKRPRKPRSFRWEDVCGKLGTDDGIDPREWLRGVKRNPKNRKTMQLCHQVERELSFALSASPDVVLQELSLMVVTPAPHAGHLKVTIGVPPGIPPGVAQSRLVEATGHLRAEMARVVSRRKVPEITFECLPLTPTGTG